MVMNHTLNRSKNREYKVNAIFLVLQELVWNIEGEIIPMCHLGRKINYLLIKNNLFYLDIPAQRHTSNVSDLCISGTIRFLKEDLHFCRKIS